MKHIFLKKFAAAVLAAATVFTLVPGIGNLYSAKAENWTLEIPVGKITDKYNWESTQTEDPKEGPIPVSVYGSAMSVTDRNEKHKKVTYSSSNKKIVTVNSKGILTGIRPGKAVVTVKNAGKTVNKYNILVKKTCLTTKVIKKNSLYFTIMKEYVSSVPRGYVLYAKNGAKYTAKSSNPDQLSLTPEKEYSVNGEFVAKAKKKGNYKITITETYKGKKTKLGTVTLKVI